jgi:hypothetical protein
MNGGITFISKDMDLEEAKTFRCPKTSHEMASILQVGIADYAPSDVLFFIEHVWSFPRDGRVSAFRFGYNYGLWKGIASACELNIYNVPPRTWMAGYDMPSNMEARERKRWLKKYAETLFPNIKITFNTSDSILIAHYAVICEEKGEMPENEEGIGIIG